MGNQGVTGKSLKVIDKHRFSSCGRMTIFQEYLALTNCEAFKVHLCKLGEKGFIPIEEIKVNEKPTAIQVSTDGFYFATEKGTLYSQLNGKKSMNLKVSDFKISSLAALTKTRILVQQNNFINLIRLTQQKMRPIYKMGHFQQKITRIKALAASQAVIAVGKSVKFIDLERRHVYHSFTDFSRLLGLSTIPDNNNIILGTGQGRGCILFDKRFNYPVFSKQTTIMDPHAVQLIQSNLAVFGGVSGALELIDLRTIKTLEIKQQLHNSCIIDIGVAKRGYSASTDGCIAEFELA